MKYALPLVLALSGCAVDVFAVTSNTFSIRHTDPMFDRAMLMAERQCAKTGARPKHLGTDRTGAFGVISRFECV